MVKNKIISTNFKTGKPYAKFFNQHMTVDTLSYDSYSSGEIYPRAFMLSKTATLAFPGLNGLRAIAAYAVLIPHCFQIFGFV